MDDTLLPVTDEMIKKVRKDLNLDEKRIKEAVEALKRWLQQQPHLPNTESDGRLERLLIRHKNSMENTKQALEMYYTFKSIAPDIMCTWDVNGKWFQDVCEQMYLITMPKLTADYDRIKVMGFLSQDHPDFDVMHSIKIAVNIFEILLCEDYNSKDVLVVDLKYIQLSDVGKFTFPLIKKTEACIMKTFKPRLRAIHFINTPPYADYAISFVKSLMKNKLMSRIHVHRTDLTEFYKQVPRHLLPEEFGGNAGTILENWNKWKMKMKSYREWFLEQNAMKSDETRRLSSSVKGNYLFGFEGSFRNLSID